MGSSSTASIRSPPNYGASSLMSKAHDRQQQLVGSERIGGIVSIGNAGTTSTSTPMGLAGGPKYDAKTLMNSGEQQLHGGLPGTPPLLMRSTGSIHIEPLTPGSITTTCGGAHTPNQGFPTLSS